MGPIRDQLGVGLIRLAISGRNSDRLTAVLSRDPLQGLVIISFLNIAADLLSNSEVVASLIDLLAVYVGRDIVKVIIRVS
jgi:hypothetical protein